MFNYNVLHKLEVMYNLREAKPEKVRFYFVTLKWHRPTCYVNWAILTGDPVDVNNIVTRHEHQNVNKLNTRVRPVLAKHMDILASL